MKTPKPKTKYRGAGFAVRTALLAVLAVGCFAMCCSFTHAWFVTERGAQDNKVELATYGVAVLDGEGNQLDALEYLCPLAPEDLHYFTLLAEGNAYTGHCIVGVTAPGASEVSYVVELAPDQSVVVSLQAAEGSLLTFSFDWGEGKNPVEPANAFGRDDTLLFYIENSRTPHLLYEVAYGATPAGIAAYYGVYVEDLCTYNGLDLAEANTPIYPTAELTYNIPYVTEHPGGLAYVPKGDLVVTVENVGGTEPPESAFVLVIGSGYAKQIEYGQFEDGVYTLEDMPAGEYQIIMGKAERDRYTLETTGDAFVTICENVEIEHTIVNTYTRHVGNLMLWLEASDETVEIPEDAMLILDGPDDIYHEIYYYELDEGSLSMESLPTGEYTVELVDAKVEYFDLTEAEWTVAVDQDKTTNATLTAEYERQVGDMEIWVVVEGHEIPAEAVVILDGPDEFDYEIPYGQFDEGYLYRKNLPAGEYTVKLLGAAVKDYDLTVTEADVVIKKNVPAEADVFVKYKRHQGNAAIRVIAEGHAVPEDSLVVLVDANDVRYEVLYEDFNEGCFTVKKLPVGEYTVEVVGADVGGYDLTLKTEGVVVEKGKTAEVQIAAAYKRQVGVLTVTVEVSGADLPAGALLTIVGPDGYSASMACESCTLRELPTGGYTVSATGVEVDGYTVAVTGGTAVVTKMGGGINVSIVYTAIKPASDENASGEQPEQTT